ncbi:hypothetical protein, partial [Burkholderia ambifaria]|uniref:hypothetical protein n=1 Tax=Burkholderia ambifaria TaxID=152480 RepID=UPI001ABB02DF
FSVVVWEGACPSWQFESQVVIVLQKWGVPINQKNRPRNRHAVLKIVRTAIATFKPVYAAVGPARRARYPPRLQGSVSTMPAR